MVFPETAGCRSDAATTYEAGPITDPCIILASIEQNLEVDSLNRCAVKKPFKQTNKWHREPTYNSRTIEHSQSTIIFLFSRHTAIPKMTEKATESTGHNWSEFYPNASGDIPGDTKGKMAHLACFVYTDHARENVTQKQ